MLHLCAIGGVLAILGTAFWFLGSTVVAGFCVLQIFVVFGSGLLFAVHATDGECITLYPDKLVVQLYDGLHSRSYTWHPHWVRIVEGRGRSKGCFWLCHGNTRVSVGRHLSLYRRYKTAAEITRALRMCRNCSAVDWPYNFARSDQLLGNSTASSILRK